MTEAKFHNISQYIDPKYEKYEYVKLNEKASESEKTSPS